MSSFLDELKQSAMTEKEISQKDAVIKQQEEIRKERLQVQYKKDFEDFLLRCLPKIKQSCLDAVKSANYITYNDKRYLICTLQLKQSHSYDYDSSDDYFYIEFSCNKLKKTHLFESKKEYYISSERFDFDYIIKILNNMATINLKKLGLKGSGVPTIINHLNMLIYRTLQKTY